MNTTFYKVKSHIPLKYGMELNENDIVAYAGMHYSFMRVATPREKAQIIWQTSGMDLKRWIEGGLVEPLTKNEMYKISPHISDSLRYAYKEYFKTFC